MDHRYISAEELTPALFSGFQRRQEVRQVWRKEDGIWVIREAPRFIENWGEQQHTFICWCLKETLAGGGMVAGCFAEGRLKGIISVNAEAFGSRKQYLEIPFLQVSQEMRGQGIGRRLLDLAKAFAKEKGAQKLYISSSPAVETQAFYKAMGCVEAEEYSAEHAERNPDDCQIECSL